MTDVFSKAKRSEIMRHIGPKDSTPEKYVRSLVHRMGFRFRLHVKALPGNPDIVLPKYRKVIFVHGCFWHGHKRCSRAGLPATNAPFWENKIRGNAKRDKRTYRKLKALGWGYIVLWQCQIDKTSASAVCARIGKFLIRSQLKKATGHFAGARRPSHST